ncbi:hypothetical protein H7F20_09115 [Robiginitalea sp. SC105]|nr:hypothetical protein [Robiginitalea sp. SC105]
MLAVLIATGCKSDNKKSGEPLAEEPAAPPVVEVVTKSMEFFAPDTIPSGWNTFVYKNQSTEPHFILLDNYPEGKTIADTKKEVIPPFDAGMELIMEGRNDEAMEAFGKLPEWFSQIVFSGGTGIISAGETAISTVKLKPGYYVMECYVKMPDGKFHASMGMAKPLIVTEADSGLEAPEADVSITLSSEEGIVFPAEIPPGESIFSVTHADQIVHENFMGHDLSLVRLDEGADLEALEAWMNWATPDGLMSSTLPDGVTFMGGINDAPAGTTQYFEAVLTPGSYAFISEVPNASEKGMLKPFEVVIE